MKTSPIEISQEDNYIYGIQFVRPNRLLLETSSMGKVKSYTDDTFLHDHLPILVDEAPIELDGYCLPKSFRAEWLISVVGKINSLEKMEVRLILTWEIIDQTMKLKNFWFDVLNNPLGIEFDLLNFVNNSLTNLKLKTLEELSRHFSLASDDKKWMPTW